MIRVQEEPFSRWSREAVERGLFEAHWREVGEDIEAIPLDPDFKRLLMLENCRVLAGFTARSEDGTLAGYAMMMVMPHLVHKQHLFAFCQEIYLAPEHRGHGMELVRAIEREMRGRGVCKILFEVTDEERAIAAFKGLGYRMCRHTLAKLL